MHQYCASSPQGEKEFSMRFINPVVPDPGFITMGIKMAQSTASDVMPAFRYSRAPTVASGPATPKPAPRKSVLATISDWLYRQQVAEREAYLARATDLFDLERRMRDFDHHPNFY
jgi:hypothetical protein